MKRKNLIVILIIIFILGYQSFINAIDYSEEFKKIRERGDKLLKEEKYNEALSAFSIAYLIIEDIETKNIILNKIGDLRKKEIKYADAGFGINKQKRIIAEAIPLKNINGEKLGLGSDIKGYIINIYNRSKLPVQLNVFATEIKAISKNMKVSALTSLDIGELNVPSEEKNKFQKVLPAGQIFFPGSQGRVLLIFKDEFPDKNIKRIVINGLIVLSKKDIDKDELKTEDNKLDKEELIKLNIEFMGI